AAFPRVTVQFEQIEDDPFHIGVGVYGVEAPAVKWVEEKILDIDIQICSDTEFALTPLVRDEATTNQYYPQYAFAWKSQRIHSACVAALEIREQMDISLLMFSQTQALTWEYPQSPLVAAAAEELALAA